MYDLFDRFVVWARYSGKWILIGGAVVLIAIVAGTIALTSGGSSTTATTYPTPAQRAAACAPALAAVTSFTKSHSPTELSGTVAKDYAKLFASVEASCTTAQIHTLEVSVLAPWYKTGKIPTPTTVPGTTHTTVLPAFCKQKGASNFPICRTVSGTPTTIPHPPITTKPA